MVRVQGRIVGMMVFILLIGWPLAVHGEDKSDLLTAERMYYEKQGKVLRANGLVHFSGGDYDLHADSLRYDTEKDIIYAEGNIKLRVNNIGKEKKSGSITAEKLVYSKSEKRLLTEGNVSLQFNGSTLTARMLEYNEKGKIVTASGQVVVKGDAGDSVAGESYHYDINSDVSTVEDFTYNFTFEDTVFYGSGRRLIQHPDKTITEDGVLSTCNLQQPNHHYYFNFKRSEYYPAHKLVLIKASYWDHGHKIFEQDKLSVSLKDQVAAGYSQDEGVYIKAQRRYSLSGQDYGILYRDYMSRKGFGLGVREYYFLTDNRRQEYFVYGAGRYGGDKTTFIGESNFYAPGKDNLLSFRYDNGLWQADNEQYQGTWSFATSTEKARQSLQINYNKQLYAWLGQKSWNEQTSVQISEDFRISDHLRGAFNGNVYRSRYSAGNEDHDRNYAVTLDYSDKNYFAQLYNYEAKYGLDYTPKISLNSNFNTPIQFEITTAQIARNHSDFTVQQSDIKANYVSQPMKMLGNSFFSYNANVATSTFSNGNHLLNWTVSPSLQTNFSPDFYVTTRYNVQRNKGYNPVTMFSGQDTQTMDWNANWRIDDDYSTMVNGGYDIDSKLYSPLNVSIQGKTYPFWNWNLTAAFNLNEHYTDSVGLYTVLNQQTGLTGYIGVNYSPRMHRLQNLSGRLQFDFGKAWDMDMQFYYDTNQKKFNASEIKLIRKFHCRDIQVFMYPQAQQYYIYYVLKNP